MKQTLLVSAICGLSFVANAQTINFSGISNGDVVAEQFAPLGVHISTVGTEDESPSSLAHVLDTTLGESNFSEQFDAGNISYSADMGNILLFNHDEFDFRSEDDAPDVQQLIFNFDYQVQSFGFVAMGFDDDLSEHASIDFYLNDGLAASVSFSAFEAGGLFDSGALFDGHSINQINEFSIAGGFDRAVFNIGDSIGLDNINFSVPAPGTMVLLGVGMVAGCRRRR